MGISSFCVKTRVRFLVFRFSLWVFVKKIYPA